jgi:hypothetical protein
LPLRPPTYIPLLSPDPLSTVRYFRAYFRPPTPMIDLDLPSRSRSRSVSHVRVDTQTRKKFLPPNPPDICAPPHFHV